MKKIAYIFPAATKNENLDGGEIYHRKFIEAGVNSCDEFAKIPVNTSGRSFSLPFWSQKIVDSDLKKIIKMRDEGYRLVVSHETIFGEIVKCLAGSKSDVLLVHNYFPRFKFKARLFLQFLYRFFSRRYYYKSFFHTRNTVFFGYGDYSAAYHDFTKSCIDHNAFHLCQIPPASMSIDYNFDFETIHFSGSDVWLPKKISAPSDNEILKLRNHFFLKDYFEYKQSCFSLITDKFDVGFKLKLMQAMAMGDYIFSMVDLTEEVKSIHPDYHWYVNIQKVTDIIDLKDNLPHLDDTKSGLRKKVATEVANNFNWHDHCEYIIEIATN